MDALTIGAFFARNPDLEVPDNSALPEILDDAMSPSSSVAAIRDQDGNWTGGSDEFMKPHNPFEVILAYKIGNISLGWSYYLANSKIHNDNDIVDTEYDGKAVYRSSELGVSADLGNMKAEGWLRGGVFGAKMEMENGRTDELTINEGELGGRVFFNMTDSLALVPALRLSGTVGEVEWDESGWTQEYVNSELELGASAQYTADKLFLIGSAGLLWSKFEKKIEYDPSGYEGTFSENNDEFMVPVVGMGLEYMAKDWLTLRGGMNTTTIWARNEDVTEEEDNNSGDITDTTKLRTKQETTASLGMGLHFGNLTIDATFGNFVLTGEEGGNPVTGGPTGPNLFSSLDCKYVF